MVTVKEAVNHFEKKYPDFYKMYMAKSYPKLDGYADYDTVKMHHAFSLWLYLNHVHMDDSILHLQARAANQFFQTRQPTFYINKDLVDSLLKTSIPDEDLKAHDMLWHLDDFMVMLPHGAIEMPHDGSVNALLISYSDKGKSVGGVPLPKSRDGKTTMEHTFNVHPGWGWCAVLNRTNTIIGNFNDGDKPVKHFVDADIMVEENDYHAGGIKMAAGTVEREKLKDEEQRWMSTINHLVINLILLMATPNITQASSRIKKGVIRTAGRKRPTEIWSPNWVAKGYTVRNRGGTGSGTSPRWHWRVGHWRHVWYVDKKDGDTRKRRWRWIKPTKVGI